MSFVISSRVDLRKLTFLVGLWLAGCEAQSATGQGNASASDVISAPLHGLPALWVPTTSAYVPTQTDTGCVLAIDADYALGFCDPFFMHVDDVMGYAIKGGIELLAEQFPAAVLKQTLGQSSILNPAIQEPLKSYRIDEPNLKNDILLRFKAGLTDDPRLAVTMIMQVPNLFCDPKMVNDPPEYIVECGQVFEVTRNGVFHQMLPAYFIKGFTEKLEEWTRALCKPVAS